LSKKSPSSTSSLMKLDLLSCCLLSSTIASGAELQPADAAAFVFYNVPFWGKPETPATKSGISRGNIPEANINQIKMKKYVNNEFDCFLGGLFLSVWLFKKFELIFKPDLLP
jgi:hypothetical protein